MYLFMKRFLKLKFHFFFNEFISFSKVDAAVIEVGIGGELDSTNIIRTPIVCGIASLGLDHVKILGNKYDYLGMI